MSADKLIGNVLLGISLMCLSHHIGGIFLWTIGIAIIGVTVGLTLAGHDS